MKLQDDGFFCPEGGFLTNPESLGILLVEKQIAVAGDYAQNVW